MNLEIYDAVIAQLRRENAAQLAELNAISASLGTNEGHSSVFHIENLKDNNRRLYEALLAIRDHCDRLDLALFANDVLENK